MINSLIDMISKFAESLARFILFIVIKFFAILFNTFRIIVQMLSPILSKAVTYIVILVVVIFIVYNYIL